MPDDGSEFGRAFQDAVQFAFYSGFSNILELKPVQEEALLHFIKRKDVFAVLPTGRGKSLIFQLVLRVCAYLHDRGFNYPKAAVLFVVCPSTALEGYTSFTFQKQVSFCKCIQFLKRRKQQKKPSGTQGAYR